MGTQTIYTIFLLPETYFTRLLPAKIFSRRSSPFVITGIEPAKADNSRSQATSLSPYQTIKAAQIWLKEKTGPALKLTYSEQEIKLRG